MATTQPSNPTCVLDEIGSAVSWTTAVRVMGALWSVPAVLLAIAGYRFAFDEPTSPLAATYVDISRAATVCLAAFTLVVGGIWLVRTRATLPRFSEIGGRWLTWQGHLRLLLLSVLALVAASAMTEAPLAGFLAPAAVVSGFGAGLVIPRWVYACGPNSRRTNVSNWSLLAPSLLATVIVAEVTLGWAHSVSMADGASMTSGWLAMARGVMISAAVLMLVIGSNRAGEVMNPESAE